MSPGRTDLGTKPRWPVRSPRAGRTLDARMGLHVPGDDGADGHPPCGSSQRWTTSSMAGIPVRVRSDLDGYGCARLPGRSAGSLEWSDYPPWLGLGRWLRNAAQHRATPALLPAVGHDRQAMAGGDAIRDSLRNCLPAADDRLDGDHPCCWTVVAANAGCHVHPERLHHVGQASRHPACLRPRCERNRYRACRLGLQLGPISDPR